MLISLCIPTKNRYDKFLSIYLDKYIDFLNEGIIDEIIIVDETGDDYNKIYNKYNKTISLLQEKFRVYKNDKILGVFLNKYKVCMLANNNYIALIDSDNFCDKSYFETAKKYIIDNNDKILDQAFILAPCIGEPYFNFSDYTYEIITKYNLNIYFTKTNIGVLLNTGNYILTKKIISEINISNVNHVLDKITACDVMYFLLLVFQQFNDFKFIVVKDMKYLHNVHDDSEYIKTNQKCIFFRDKYIKPAFFTLSKNNNN